VWLKLAEEKMWAVLLRWDWRQKKAKSCAEAAPVSYVERLPIIPIRIRLGFVRSSSLLILLRYNLKVSVNFLTGPCVEAGEGSCYLSQLIDERVYDHRFRRN